MSPYARLQWEVEPAEALSNSRLKGTIAWAGSPGQPQTLIGYTQPLTGETRPPI
jgi:hypothetical protein